MDCRCPLQLSDTPSKFCPLAVQRLKAIRNVGKELTEEEENKLPGCCWAVQAQLANYCFFKLAEDTLSNGGLSDNDIAYMNNISVDTVKKIEKKAINQIKDADIYEELRELFDGDEIISDITEDYIYE